jgi:hypothetical protein
MTPNTHLTSNEQHAFQVSRYVQDYSSVVMGVDLAKHSSPSDVVGAVSDFTTDVMHFASYSGAQVSDVLSKAFENYLEEIGDYAPKETIDRFRAFVEDAVYEATVGTALSSPAVPER